MFGNKKEDKRRKDLKSSAINIIGIGTEITGDLITKGDIRIEGKISGDLHSKAKVVIGETGEITGDIFSENAEVSGSVVGNLKIVETLFLKNTAKVNGNVSSNKLVVENGANLTGSCATGISNTKSIATPIIDEREKSFRKREANA